MLQYHICQWNVLLNLRPRRLFVRLCKTPPFLPYSAGAVQATNVSVASGGMVHVRNSSAGSSGGAACCTITRCCKHVLIPAISGSSHNVFVKLFQAPNMRKELVQPLGQGWMLLLLAFILLLRETMEKLKERTPSMLLQIDCRVFKFQLRPMTLTNIGQAASMPGLSRWSTGKSSWRTALRITEASTPGTVSVPPVLV